MLHEFSRTALLIGEEAIDRLSHASVAIFGVGGVGGYVAESLARSGIGHFTLFDNDTVSLTNINRQIIATHKTLGRLKVEVMKERILEINPKADVKIHSVFFTADNADEFDLSHYSYIVDAIDTVASKLLLIECAKNADIPIICSMGAGNKLDPTRFEVTDIAKTSVCPLAKVIRSELRKRKIKDVKVVYSKEEALKPAVSEETGKRQIPGSIAYVPSTAGLILASEVVKDLIK
ncbi:tRNA threonylcarbamoyladenosine dehydratase [Sinanaerobacter sp. ZZT-01]|uniref:tRNA threonylcarbamoyladenosine dehydratase n=1 Tax=Sinanaerobacter sp. ZZT-01 TaxID=3111540 RepID=UPI002D76573D|nr:tRNA threonylcarbamoyladenosine dehydratase [Sinanaerobacter sp. ZZT-01]WRR94057.1 tRNA threonylcarbamoyladenosine dehydratase [Sinanaerobacter sp. ZZT-01]